MVAHLWDLGIAFVGGLTGAFGGALGAQRIVEAARVREDAYRELRDTNAARVIAFLCCNGGLALKGQQVQPMYENLLADRAALAKAEAARAAGGTVAPLRLSADLRIFPAPVLPTEMLKDLAFHKVAAPPRALALVAAVEEAVAGLSSAISRREVLIEQMSKVAPQFFINYYMGTRSADGAWHKEYPDVVEAIHSYTDDLIFFSLKLCEDLAAHGNATREALPKRARARAPKVNVLDFSGPRSKGLIPSEEQYERWLRGFQSQPEASSKTARNWYGKLFGR